MRLCRELSLAALLSCWLLGHATARAEDETPTAEPTESSASQAPSVAPATPPQSETAIATRELRKAKLQAELSKVERESASRSLLLPWAALSISAAAVATGLVLGLSHGLGCEHSCTSSAWPGWLVLVGTTTGTASLVWLELRERSDAELLSRRRGLERELERIHWDEMPRQPQAALRWTGQF